MFDPKCYLPISSTDAACSLTPALCVLLKVSASAVSCQDNNIHILQKKLFRSSTRVQQHLTGYMQNKLFIVSQCTYVNKTLNLELGNNVNTPFIINLEMINF